MWPTGSNSIEGVTGGILATGVLLSSSACWCVPSSLLVSSALAVCSRRLGLVLRLLTRPTSCRHTGHTQGFPCPESTQIFQQEVSNMCPQRSILIGLSSVPIRGMPKLSTRLSFCFCFVDCSSLSNSLFAVSNGSRHIGHWHKREMVSSSSTEKVSLSMMHSPPLSETLFGAALPFLSLQNSFDSFSLQKRIDFCGPCIRPKLQTQK